MEIEGEGGKRSSHLQGHLSNDYISLKFDLCSQLILVVFPKKSATPLSWKVSQVFKAKSKPIQTLEYKLGNIIC